jgi:phospholipid:diacylglycerol acyltransferase
LRGRRRLTCSQQFGFERDEEQLIKNNDDHSKWSNPLEVQLPKAPSMTIYCLYGVGKETERAYFYQQGAALPHRCQRALLTSVAAYYRRLRA